jgi:hypothetical protein
MNASEQPVLIFSPPRSGSTLMSRMLNAQPEIAVMFEAGLFSALSRLGCRTRFRSRAQYLAFLEGLWSSSDGMDVNLSAAVLHMAKRETPPLVANALFELGGLYAELNGASRWGEKTPSSLFHQNTIASLLPDAAHVHLVRDPRDVVGSIFRVWHGARIEDDALVRVVAHVKVYLQLLGEAGERWRHILVRYEDLVSEPGDTMLSISSFLGVSSSDIKILSAEDRVTSHLAKTLAHDRLLEPIDGRSVGRATEVLSPQEVAFVETCLEEEMSLFGYNPGRAVLRAGSRKTSAVERRAQGLKWGLFELGPRARGHAKVLAAEIPLVRSLPFVARRVASPDVWRRRCDDCSNDAEPAR